MSRLLECTGAKTRGARKQLTAAGNNSGVAPTTFTLCRPRIMRLRVWAFVNVIKLQVIIICSITDSKYNFEKSKENERDQMKSERSAGRKDWLLNIIILWNEKKNETRNFVSWVQCGWNREDNTIQFITLLQKILNSIWINCKSLHTGCDTLFLLHLITALHKKVTFFISGWPAVKGKWLCIYLVIVRAFLNSRHLSCSIFTCIYHHQDFHPSRCGTLSELSWIPAAGSTDGKTVASAVINIPGESRFTWLASGHAGGTPKLCCTPVGESRRFPAGCRWRSGSGGPPFPPGWPPQRRTRRPDSLPPCTGARPPGRGPGTTSPSCRATWSRWGEGIHALNYFAELTTGIVCKFAWSFCNWNEAETNKRTNKWQREPC